MINKWVIMGGLAALGAGAYFYLKPPATEAADETSDGSTWAYPMTYATAFGGIPSSGVGGGSISNETGMAALAAAFDQKGMNELALGMASLSVEKDLGLATIKSGVDINANNNASDYLTKFLAMSPTLSKLGISGIGGGYNPTANGGFNIDAGMIYTNPALNLAFASGYNEKGDLVSSLPGGKSSILIQDAQSVYDMTKFIDMTGTTKVAPVTTLGSTVNGSTGKNGKSPKPPKSPGGVNNTGITTPTGQQP